MTKIWSRADVVDSLQYKLQLCQGGDGSRFFRLTSVPQSSLPSSVEVVSVTNVVPTALLQRRDIVGIADEVALESGERFFVDAHGIWFTDSEFQQISSSTPHTDMVWSTSSPPCLPDR